MKIELSDTKGAVSFEQGSDLDFTQGQIKLRTRVLSSEVTLVDDDTEIDTAIDLPAKSKLKSWKVEILSSGGAAVNITSLGQAAGGDVDIFSGAFTLAQNAAVGTSVQGVVAASGVAPLSAQTNLFMQHADPGPQPPKVRITVMIEEIV